MTDQMNSRPGIEREAKVKLLGIPAILMAFVFSITWIGAVLAYGWGFFDLGNKILSQPSSWGIAPHVLAAFVVMALLPVAFIWMTVITLGRAAAMTRAASDLARAARRLTNPVTYMGDSTRTVIAELDREFDRLKGEVTAIDQMLGETHERLSGHVALLQSAGEAAGEQGNNLQQHLGAERQALQELAQMIGNEGAKISSILDQSSPQTEPALANPIPVSGLAKTGDPLEPAPANGQTPAENEDILQIPGKRSSIEELSSYLGQHRARHQKLAGTEPNDTTGSSGDDELSIPLLATPSLNIGIEDGQGKTAETGTADPESKVELIPDRKQSRAPDEPVPSGRESDGPGVFIPEETPPDRDKLSLAGRLDRARLPVDLRSNVEGLHALSIDLNRLLATSPPADLWRRYMNGEREVFTEHLLAWREDAGDTAIETTAASETFQRYARRFRDQFEDTIQLARTSEAGSTAVAEIMAADVSAVNDLLLALDRRTDS